MTSEPVARVELGPEQALLGSILDLPPDKREYTVADLLPAGFPRYLRVFHPFLPADPANPEGTLPGPAMTWRELADRARVKFHAAISWENLIDALGGWSEEHRPFSVREGRLEDPTRAALYRHLAAVQATDAYFVFDLGAVVRGRPRLLYRASVSDYALVQVMANEDLGEGDDEDAPGPQYVWPLDRAWIVNTDYDLDSTYVACDNLLADAILADASIETLPVAMDTRIGNAFPRIVLDEAR